MMARQRCLWKGSDSVPEEIRWSGPPAEDGWERDVWLMARRTALMYLHFARVIIDRVGEAEGKELVKEAIVNYGRQCGRMVREEALKRGMELNAETFARLSDLPSRGWRMDGGTIVLCPLAVIFAEEDEEDLGRIYCWVDQAKVEGFNPDMSCAHAHNVLDGDSFCEIVITDVDS